MFADDFAELAMTWSALPILIAIVHNYSKRWRFQANVKKCAPVVFFFPKTGEAFINPDPPTRRMGLGWWRPSCFRFLYCYLGIEFSSDGSWNKHIKSLITRNREKVGGLYKVLHNFALDLTTCRHILTAVLRPSLEYGCEVWSANKWMMKELHLNYSQMSGINEEYKGHPWKCWLAHVNSLKKELNPQDKVLDIKPIKGALHIYKRECEEFEMALEHKWKLCVYKEQKRWAGFGEYLQCVKGPSFRLFLKFRSGAHGLLEELGYAC